MFGDFDSLAWDLGDPSGTVLNNPNPFRLTIGENKNFLGAEDLFAARGVKLSVLQDPDCIALMKRFVAEKPDLWNEDIGL